MIQIHWMCIAASLSMMLVDLLSSESIVFPRSSPLVAVLTIMSDLHEKAMFAIDHERRHDQGNQEPDSRKNGSGILAWISDVW